MKNTKPEKTCETISETNFHHEAEGSMPKTKPEQTMRSPESRSTKLESSSTAQARTNLGFQSWTWEVELFNRRQQEPWTKSEIGAFWGGGVRAGRWGGGGVRISKLWFCNVLVTM